MKFKNLFIFITVFAVFCATAYPVEWKSSKKKTKIPFKVVIDPGHGGGDAGAVVRGGIKEKYITMSISYRILKYLRSWGVDAVMTRYGDSSLTLNDRVRIINRHNPDLTVSIHANFSKAKSVNGFESYMYKERAKRGDLVAFVHQIDPFRFVFPMNRARTSKSTKDLQMGYFIHKKIKKFTGADDRGIKAAHFFVLRNVDTPCLLIETGFISNQTEVTRLVSKPYQNSMARGIAEGIMLSMYGESQKLYKLIAQNSNISDTALELPDQYQSPKKRRTFRFPFAFVRGIN